VSQLTLLLDGCFWHCCPSHSNLPVNNREFWRVKLVGNRRRDRRVGRALRAEGWRVLRVWEHELARSSERVLVRRIRGMLDS